MRSWCGRRQRGWEDGVGCILEAGGLRARVCELSPKAPKPKEERQVCKTGVAVTQDERGAGRPMWDPMVILAGLLPFHSPGRGFSVSLCYKAPSVLGVVSSCPFPWFRPSTVPHQQATHCPCSCPVALSVFLTASQRVAPGPQLSPGGL